MFTRRWHRALTFLFSLVAALMLGSVSPVLAFVFTGVSWPTNTTINMQLALGATSVALQDGSGTWNNSAANALGIWNQQLQGVQFSSTQTSGTTGSAGDRVNTVFFSNTVFGEAFGANTLAVTIWRYQTSAPTVTTEADVVFNTSKKFNSYRGPIQSDARTGVPTYDFRRVALHEFGHVLGLDHPDEKGQPGITALMNSQTSDLETLAADDIAGANQLYRTATGSAPAGTLQAKFDFAVNRLASDPVRPRVYATVPSTNSVAVIDTTTLTVVQSVFVGSNPVGLAVSADGSKLWVANSGSTSSAVGVIDLNTLQALPSLPAPNFPSDIEEGLNNRLYVTPASQSGGIMEIDAATGAAQGTFGGFEVYTGGSLEISPDRKTLYFANKGLSPATAMRFDVSAAAPVVLQQTRFSGGNGEDLALSHDGRRLVFPNGAGNGTPPYTTFNLSSGDFGAVDGSFNVGPYPDQAAFSNDDTILYHSADSQSKVLMFDTKTYVQVGAIPLGSNPNDSGGYNARDLAVDNTGALLFVATSYYPQNGDLRIYSTGRKDPPKPAPAGPKTLLNVSTRLRSEAGDQALICGFILRGSEPKKVMLRAIGPSLPVAGKMLDPNLSLRSSDGRVVKENDDWTSNSNEILSTGLQPSDSRESALIATLNSDAYTAILRPADGQAGVSLVELYDLSASASSRILNISTRGKVDTGDNVMIAGFIVGGDIPMKVVVRAIGPSLGIPGTLGDTVLDLMDANGTLLARNDDWRTDQESDLVSTGIPPSDNRESAILRDLPAGNYTAIVRGKNDTKGIALVEVYNLDPN